jgi:hypothetical protein
MGYNFTTDRLSALGYHLGITRVNWGLTKMAFEGLLSFHILRGFCLAYDGVQFCEFLVPFQIKRAG